MLDTIKIINNTFDFMCKINPCPSSTYKIFVDFMRYVDDKNDENIRKFLRNKISNMKIIENNDGEIFRLEMKN